VKIKRRVTLLHRSSSRLLKALEVPRDPDFWRFMKKYSLIHLKRTLQLLWIVWRKDED